MNSEAAQLMRCLRQILQVIGKANDILAGVSRPSVCSEVLLSVPGTAYILGLSEVYRVSKRLEEGMKVRKLGSEALQSSLREVDLTWNNLLSFLALGHPTFRTLWDWQPSLESNPCLPDSNLVPNRICRVCLTEVKLEPEVHSGNCDPVLHQGSCYHASCANFWLNCVDTLLPREM